MYIEVEYRSKDYVSVTKNLSNYLAQDDDAEKINHRIPHRFEPITNIGANWCCHCGYMLPLGRKNARRCTECDITCHANCAHLVPDFCGMSMETANILLRDWKDINKARTGRVQRPGPTQTPSAQSQISQYPGGPTDMDQMMNDMDRMKLTGNEPPPPPKPTDYGYGRQYQQTSPQDGRPPDHRMAAQMQQAPSPYPPGTPTSAPRPLPGGRPAFPIEPVQPMAQPGRAVPPYEQDGYYQVSDSFIRSWKTYNFFWLNRCVRSLQSLPKSNIRLLLHQ